MAGVLIKEEIGTQIHRQGGHLVRMKVESGVMFLQAKDHQRVPAKPQLGDGHEILLHRLRRNRSYQSLDLGLPASRTVRQYISVV